APALPTYTSHQPSGPKDSGIISSTWVEKRDNSSREFALALTIQTVYLPLAVTSCIE
ncbi:hypothetical protein Bpfe_009961, partial [Biomphalaria pfeifferi]